MDDHVRRETELLRLLSSHKQEIKDLKARLKALESSEERQKQPGCTGTCDGCTLSYRCGFSNDEILRFSRQIILPEIGVQGQLKLKRAKVLIIGAGGLGCPSALYLAAAGIGCLGFVDYDAVDGSNLHRQILHREKDIGKRKVWSAANAVKRLNADLECRSHDCALSSKNALDIIKDYDVIVDASDNAATRYLLNDACVLAKKPLVSGSALKWEGQKVSRKKLIIFQMLAAFYENGLTMKLTVYNFKGGPCYRCIFPEPPPPHAVTNCSEGGIIGAVTGVIGSLQALETIKIIVQDKSSYRQKLLLFDGLDGNVRTVKLRNRKTDCRVCGDHPTISELQDYVQFCGAAATDKEKDVKLLHPKDRVTVETLQRILQEHKSTVLLDVRSTEEFQICGLNNSINLPMEELKECSTDQLNSRLGLERSQTLDTTILVICRRGNDSQRAVPILEQKLSVQCKDVQGGLHAWSTQIDPSFPKY